MVGKTIKKQHKSLRNFFLSKNVFDRFKEIDDLCENEAIPDNVKVKRIGKITRKIIEEVES
tara:strand:+ start:21673 stop:21855 length:183 start_codon:yes stop_codon:yes gene_type:complete